MSAVSVTHAHPSSLSLNRLGLWLFMISESMIFLILLFSRFYLFGVGHPEELSQLVGLVVTVVLLLSSLTAYQAEVAAAHGDRTALLRNLLLTIVLGTAFLIGVVGVEWPEALHGGITPQSGFGIAYFSMTGMHAFHVLTGVLLLIVVYLNARRGAYSPESHWGVEGTVKYWHFVDLVWVFFYPALYLVR